MTPQRRKKRAKVVARITPRAFARMAANDNGVSWQERHDERRVARWLREYDAWSYTS